NLSPQLSWSGFPAGTKSFAITCFDPDAPTPSGWWHWCAVDIPAATTALARGAGQPRVSGDQGIDLPSAAIQLRHDGGGYGYYGAAPPHGDRPHRYYFAVNALDVPELGVTQSSTASLASFTATFHMLARAVIVATYQR
ncbi:MAG: YbhB/YbcL family Raf kinase inhibitor-like protein, partial [Bifidobacteriaceae bacterium]|nr:YbhB/YbcL family Raf kinase inhibitor-like protein [Bifidobacteriaceae bacterium]